jgi:hypothetical protein
MWCTAELTVTGPRAEILPDMSDDGEKSLHFTTHGRLNGGYPVESTYIQNRRYRVIMEDVTKIQVT